MKKKGTEVWVGIFVVIGIILLVLMTVKIEKFQVGKRAGYPLHIFFESVAGLEQNSPVRVSGVRVGDVEKVALEKGRAKVTFRVPPDVTLYKDAKAYLKSEGFLGEKYVEITPGTPGNPKVEPGGNIEQGAPPVDVEQFLSNMSTIREDLKEVIKPLENILKAVDPKRVEGMMTKVDKFSGQLSDIGDDAKKTFQKGTEAFSVLYDVGDKVRKGEGTLGKLVTDEGVFQDARKAVDTVKELVEKVKETAETLKNVSEKIERGEGTLGKLLQDESLYKEAKDTLHTLKGVAEKVERGEGTLGKLINDDTLVKETEKTMKKVQKAAEGIQEQTPITVLGTIIGLFF